MLKAFVAVGKKANLPQQIVITIEIQEVQNDFLKLRCQPSIIQNLRQLLRLQSYRSNVLKILALSRGIIFNPQYHLQSYWDLLT